MIITRNVELSDVDIRDRQRVHNIVTVLEEMWRGELGDVKGRAHIMDPIQKIQPTSRAVILSRPPQTQCHLRKHKRATTKKQSNRDRAYGWHLSCLSPSTMGDWNFYVNYWLLHILTTRDTYSMLIIGKCLDILATGQYITTIGCNNRYWKTPTALKDSHKTAIVSQTVAIKAFLAVQHDKRVSVISTSCRHYFVLARM